MLQSSGLVTQHHTTEDLKPPQIDACKVTVFWNAVPQSSRMVLTFQKNAGLHYRGTRLIACACRGKAITGSTGREERQGEWRNSVGLCSECENSVWK